MIKVDPRSPVPLFQQIKTALRDLFARGLLKPGDELQSVSQLAQTLLVNPHVVTRAYQELIKEGFLTAEPGKAPVVATGSSRRTLPDRAELIQEFILAAQQLTEAGLDWEELNFALQMLKKKERTSNPAEQRATTSLCPYCRSGIVEEAETVSCLLCKTIHHRECWDEAGRCSVFGCKGKVKLLL